MNIIDAMRVSQSGQAALPLYNDRMMKHYWRAKFIVTDNYFSFYIIYADTGRYFQLASDDQAVRTHGRNDWKPVEQALDDWDKENGRHEIRSY